MLWLVFFLSLVRLSFPLELMPKQIDGRGLDSMESPEELEPIESRLDPDGSNSNSKSLEAQFGLELNLDESQSGSDSKSDSDENLKVEINLESDGSQSESDEADSGEVRLGELYADESKLNLTQSETKFRPNSSDESKPEFEEPDLKLDLGDLAAESGQVHSNLGESNINLTQSDLGKFRPNSAAESNKSPASHLFLLNGTSLVVVANGNKKFSDAVLLLIATLDETCRNLTGRIAAFYLPEPPWRDTFLDVVVYANNLFLERVIAHVTFANVFADEVLYGVLQKSRANRSLNRFAEDLVRFSPSLLQSRIALGLAGLLVAFLASGDVAEKLLSFLN